VGVAPGDRSPSVSAANLVDHDAVQVGHDSRLIGVEPPARRVQLAESLLHDVLWVVVAEQPRQPDQSRRVAEEERVHTVAFRARLRHIDSMHARDTRRQPKG